MNERGKSGNLVVPAKPPNNAGGPAAEVVEGRGLAEGNTARSTRPGRSAGQGVPSGLGRVREVARRDKEARFTVLLHHVGLDRLWAAYAAINPKAAPGVDQVTWDACGQDLRENLEDLLRRVRSGAYRASPSRRVYIPKPDGRQRPLGIATLEDKILQRAMVEVLNAVYEEDFLGFSYGFRESAGINRHGGGDGRALRRRASDPRRPRAMRRRPARAWRSVGRGTCRPGYRAAKSVFRGAGAVRKAEGNIAGGANASRQRTPRGRRTRACAEPPCARTGRARARPFA